MIEYHPRMMARLMRTAALAGRGGPLATVSMLRRGRPVWGNSKGCRLLVRWSGERLPLPGLDAQAERPAVVVGWAAHDAADILEWPGVAHAENTVYHFAVVPVSGGGVVGPLNPLVIQSVAFDGLGEPRGLMPNAPGALAVRLLPGRKPLVSWAYSTWGQQAAPQSFNVYAAVGAAAWNFGSPVASVSYRAGQTRYAWVGPALSPGDEVYYTVRARSAAGVLSLIPRLAGGPAPSYSDVAKARSLKVIVPSGPPAPATYLASEVR